MSRKGTGATRLPLDEEIPRPTFRRERTALKRGVWPVAGCDEAGRGPLAGPVVAAAVILNPDDVPRGLDDSKRLTPERREVLYERICARAQVAVALAPPWRIDRDNILRASLWALRRAVAALPVRPCLVFVDGPEHFAALDRLGPTVHHRRSFSPVAGALGEQTSDAEEAVAAILPL